MKTVNRILGRVSVIFACLMMLAQVSVSGNVGNSANDNFSITTADNSVNASAWNLKYATSENDFRITLEEKNGDKEYLVRSKFFEIAYILNKNGFGARMIRGNKMQVPAQILDKIINQEALKNQKVISDANTNNETALNLIASYLPDLINNNYKQLLQ